MLFITVFFLENSGYQHFLLFFKEKTCMYRFLIQEETFYTVLYFLYIFHKHFFHQSLYIHSMQHEHLSAGIKIFILGFIPTYDNEFIFYNKKKHIKIVNLREWEDEGVKKNNFFPLNFHEFPQAALFRIKSFCLGITLARPKNGLN